MLGIVAALSKDDPSQAAKALADFRQANPTLRSISGLRSSGDLDGLPEAFIVPLLNGLRAAGVPE